MSLREVFEWRDPSLDVDSLCDRMQLSLDRRPRAAEDSSEARLLHETWTPTVRPDMEARLALHFMERFAPITERVARGLAYTAITTLRLERPIGQQEEYNRAVLLFSKWAADSLQRADERISALEARLAMLPREIA